LQDFLAKHGNSKWKAILDIDKASRRYGIVEVDSTVIVNKNCNVAFKNLRIYRLLIIKICSFMDRST
jgi:hypothetical protein